MGSEASKVIGQEEDSIDAYIDRDGGYIVNKHRRTATMTTIDIGLSQEKEDRNVREFVDRKRRQNFIDKFLD